MKTDADFVQNYAINEEIIGSTSTDSNAKVTAWRQQGVILEHCLRNTSNATFSAVMEQHSKKLDYNVYDDFLKQRAQRVEDLLKDAPIVAAEPIDDSILFAELGEVKELVEAACHGVYESCVHDEITEDHLKKLSEATKVNEAVPALSGQPVVQPTRDLKKPTETASVKTLYSYFGSSRIEVGNELQRTRKKPQANQQNKADTVMEPISSHAFRTAREELMVQNMKKFGNANGRSSSTGTTSASTPLFNYGASKKSLGARRTVNSGFVPPILRDECSALTAVRGSPSSLPTTPTSTPPDPIEPIDERLVNIDPKMIELISNEIMHKNQSVDWSDIAGLDYAKSIIKEAVVYPLLRPDIFTGLRRPPRGILLFGPPGTGKTLIGKCIASQSKSTFFSISASSLTSKWVGEGEKMVRALFAVAAVHQPAVVFIDEIDSLLTQRSESEHESSRRLKTEFLVQLDGAATSDDDRILIVGATNRPQELDEAARRRLVRRLYIPLPELRARVEILTNLLQTVRHSLNSIEITEVGNMTNGYSGADMESLCREASMEPIRSIPAEQIVLVDVENLRPIGMQDFIVALQSVRPSVSQDDLKQYTEWNSIYGAGK